MSMAQVIRAAMKKQGVTVSQLSRQLGCTTQNISGKMRRDNFSNIPLSVMKQAADLDDRRIYDRILEVCVPIRFDGENFRKGNASANIKKAAEMLNG